MERCHSPNTPCEDDVTTSGAIETQRRSTWGRGDGKQACNRTESGRHNPRCVTLNLPERSTCIPGA